MISDLNSGLGFAAFAPFAPAFGFAAEQRLPMGAVAMVIFPLRTVLNTSNASLFPANHILAVLSTEEVNSSGEV